MENKKTIAKGFYVSKRENAPGFVFGKISIKVEDAMAFLEEHVNEAGYVNIDMLWNKDGDKITPFLDEWKPSVRSDSKPQSSGSNDSFKRTQKSDVRKNEHHPDSESYNDDDDLPF